MLFYISEYFFRCRKCSFILLLTVCVLLYLVIIYEEEPEIKSIHVPWLKIPPDKVLFFTFNSEKIINLLDKRYLSFSIDSSQIYSGLRNPSLKEKSLRRKIKHLSGGYLRVGGTAADMLVFSPTLRAWPERYMETDGGLCAYERIGCGNMFSKHHIRKFSMSASQWHEINNFAKAVGLKLLFDLNVLLRNGSSWNSSNAEYLIDYSFAYQYNIDWQLGNEPNIFPQMFGTEVAPDSLAQDFNILRRLLNRYAKYNVSKLVGPDVTNPKKKLRPEMYLRQFLANKPEISAVTWHHYYTGPNTTLNTFLNVSLYEEFTETCRSVVDDVKFQTPLKPIWITETGSAYGGGIKNLSDTFIGSFVWLDKLGITAREGISVVVRQSLYSGIYSLLDHDTLNPNPDYWVSILYKKLVGRKVLNVSCDSCSTNSLRVYGHCSQNSPRIVFYGINLAHAPLGFSLPLNITTSALLYSLTAPSLTSRYVDLNGDRLYLSLTDALPPLRPILITLDSPVLILPYSIFFLEVDVALSVCL